MSRRARANNNRLILRAFLLLVASFPLLASSVTFCESGDIYNKSYDQSDEFSSRWSNGRAQITPQWTPDGSRIVFGHHGRIYAVSADGTDLKSLSGSSESLGRYSETNEIDFSPTISPDGSQVAYTTLRYAEGGLRQHTYELAIQDIEGGDLQRVTTNTWDDVSPSWSPDGSRIAFVSERGDSLHVYVIAPDGTDERNIAPGVTAQSNAPVWAPDGSRLAFVGEEQRHQPVDWIDTYSSDRSKWVTKTSGRIVTREAMYVVEADGSDLKKLAWSNSTDTTPSTRVGINDLILPEEEVVEFRWSPDSKRIAFLAKRYHGAGSLYVADLDGSEVRQILNTYEIWETTSYKSLWMLGFGWSPDSSNMIFELVGYDYDSIINEREYTYTIQTIASDGSGLQTLTETSDDSAVEVHLEWPGIVMRQSRRGYRDPYEHYRILPGMLKVAGSARILRYDWGRHYYGPENRKPLLSIVPWDANGEKVLVMTDGRRLSLANQTNADSEDIRRGR